MPGDRGSASPTTSEAPQAKGIHSAAHRCSRRNGRWVQECNEGKWKEAAETAASAPSGVLRTQATITRLQAAPAVPGQKSPVLAYFGSLLQQGGLNAVESVEMSRIAISQNKPELVQNWMKQNKLTASEPLGDLLKEVRGRPAPAAAALAIRVQSAVFQSSSTHLGSGPVRPGVRIMMLLSL